MARADDDPHATGRLPPTPEVQNWAHTHQIITERVKLNALGLARINAHRLQQEQTALRTVEVVSLGEEVEGVTEEEIEKRGSPVATNWVPTALIPSVDNSTLKYFPPIRSQGSLGTCAQWAGIYYCFTHMNAFARDWDAKNGGDSYRFSPKFTYNLMNGGSDRGSSEIGGWYIASKHGLATLTDWPYDGDFRGWPLTPAVWRNALNVRVNSTGMIAACDTPTGLEQLKTLLVNGYVLTFGTYINSWQFTTISDDPSTSEDDAFVGKAVGYWVSGNNGSHAMTVVGYNDALWVDINGNGTVDPGEKGALRVANSWGTSWREGGFTWLAYDALKLVSGVSGGPSASRGPAWQGFSANWVTAKPVSIPSALAQFTLSQARRDEIKVSLGTSATSISTPTQTWTPNTVLQNAGGAYGFDGGTTAVDGTFVLDFSDLATTYDTSLRWYLNIQDNTSGNPTTVKSFKWINGADDAEVVRGNLPSPVDDTLFYFPVDATLTHGSGNSAPTISSLSSQVVNEDTPTGTIPFIVGDAQTAANALVITGSSSNGTLLPQSGIVFGGTGINRTCVLTPALNQNGSTTVILTVKDAGGLIAQSSFTLTVNPVNDPPVAVGLTLGVQFNTAKSILLSGTDVDGDLLSFIPTQPLHGTVTGTSPNIFYTPTTGYLGSDSFSFSASDGQFTSAPAVVHLVVNNTAPTVVITYPLEGYGLGLNARVTASASDDVSVDRVVFYLDGVAVATDTVPAYSFNWDTTLSANGPHTLTAQAFDDAGYTALSPPVNVFAINNQWAQVMATPTSLNFSAVQGSPPPPVGILSLSTSTTGALPSWTVSVSTPWISVSALSGRGSDLLSVGVDSDPLSPAVYVGTVTVSFNTGGGTALLIPVTLTVIPGTDIIPPTIPTGLSAALSGTTSVLVSWSASSDTGGSGLAGYRLYRNAELIAQPTATHHNDTGLVAGTSYDYSVSAVDTAGNESVLTNPYRIYVSTSAFPSPPAEAYGYPDPALRGTSPVIRAIVGDVLGVDITLYDARGTPVHSAHLDSPNTIVNGEPAYDYTWTGDIPSGVYYAVIHGRSGNETVKAKTRLTVIR